MLPCRKKDGVSRVFDETITDNESVASDITLLEERLRKIPLNEVDDDIDDSVSDITDYSRTDSYRWDNRRPASALPAFIRPSTRHPHTKKLRKCDPVSRYDNLC